MSGVQHLLGKIINSPQQRDAIHVAVAPVEAACKLLPGQHVGLDGDLRATDTASPRVGVVDPFLERAVQKGERFWLFLNPGTATVLRHDWVHPAFTDATPNEKTEADKWLRWCAEECNLSYSGLMSAADGWLESEDYYVQYDTSSARDFFSYDVAKDFWRHYETVTGKRVPEDKREPFFSCSC